MAFSMPTSVLITGASGSLGRKLIAHLLSSDWCRRIVAVDLAAPADMVDGNGRVAIITSDLLSRHDQWWEAAGTVEAIEHFAAQNPHTDASWNDAVASFDITCNVVDAAVAHNVRRLVFASSNHVMGGYKDSPLNSSAAGFLTTDIEPAPGTRWDTGNGWMDSTAYSTAKLMGERIMASTPLRAPERLSSVSIRIGWVQPGANRPDTINVSGDAKFQAVGAPGDEAGLRDLRWFRNMWLSNCDFANLFEAAIIAMQIDGQRDLSL